MVLRPLRQLAPSAESVELYDEWLADLDAALKVAGEYSHLVMVEEFVKGKSITVGLVEINGKPTVTPILELRPVKSEWYDLEAQVDRTRFLESFEDRVRSIRERRDRERRERRQEEGGGAVAGSGGSGR